MRNFAVSARDKDAQLHICDRVTVTDHRPAATLYNPAPPYLLQLLRRLVMTFDLGTAARKPDSVIIHRIFFGV